MTNLFIVKSEIDEMYEEIDNIIDNIDNSTERNSILIRYMSVQTEIDKLYSNFCNNNASYKEYVLLSQFLESIS